MMFSSVCFEIVYTKVPKFNVIKCCHWYLIVYYYECSSAYIIMGFDLIKLRLLVHFMCSWCGLEIHPDGVVQHRWWLCFVL